MEQQQQEQRATQVDKLLLLLLLPILPQVSHFFTYVDRAAAVMYVPDKMLMSSESAAS